MSYAEWPLAVPYRPERDMWGVKPVRDAAETQMEGGNVRLRRKPGDRLATMRWGRQLNPAETAAFLAFVASIGEGTHRFLMPVCLDGSTYTIRLVQITGGLPEETTPGGGWLTVNLSLLVFPAEMVAPIPTILSFGDAVSGVAVSGAEVEVDFGGLASGTTVASAGAFSVVTPYLTPGLVKLRVRYTNAGNPGPWSVPVEMVSPAPMQAGLATLLRNQAGLVLDFAGTRKALSTIPSFEYLGPVAGLPGLTFARASAASYIDAAGQIQFAASGQPRFDHDATTLAPLGFLVESARANALANPIWSGPTTPTSWNSYDPAGVSIVPSKFGPAVSARRFTAENSRPRLHQAVTLAAGVTYAFSVEVEGVSGSLATGHVVNTLTPGTTVTFPVCPANPAGGTSGAVGVGKLVYTVVSATTQAATIQMGAGVQHNLVGMAIDLSMPQLEAGTWPTSFIPGGARAAERLYSALPFDPATDGVTAAIRARTPNASADYRTVYLLGRPDISDRVFMHYQGGSWQFGYSRNNTTYFLLTTPAPAGVDVRIAFSVTSIGIFKLSLNGAPVVTFDRTAIPLVLGKITTEYFGSNPTVAEYASTIERVARWKGTPFTDAQLQGLLS